VTLCANSVAELWIGDRAEAQLDQVFPLTLSARIWWNWLWFQLRSYSSPSP